MLASHPKNSIVTISLFQTLFALLSIPRDSTSSLALSRLSSAYWSSFSWNQWYSMCRAGRTAKRRSTYPLEGQKRIMAIDINKIIVLDCIIEIDVDLGRELKTRFLLESRSYASMRIHISFQVDCPQFWRWTLGCFRWTQGLALYDVWDPLRWWRQHREYRLRCFSKGRSVWLPLESLWFSKLYTLFTLLVLWGHFPQSLYLIKFLLEIKLRICRLAVWNWRLQSVPKIYLFFWR
jgi:hypothetical protein